MRYVQLVRRRFPSRSFVFLTLVISVFVLDYVQAQNTPQSPCPQVFQYSFDGAEWFGLLSLTGLQLGQTIRIDMDLSLRDKLPSSYPGALELFLSREQTLQNIVENKPILYRIRFPVQNPLPTVSQILINNQIICAGPADTAPQVTTIKLEHSLYTKLEGQLQTNQIPIPVNQIYIPESGQFGTFDIQTNNNLGPVEQNVQTNGNLGVPVQNNFQSSPQFTVAMQPPPKIRPRPPAPIQLSPETTTRGELYPPSTPSSLARPNKPNQSNSEQSNSEQDHATGPNHRQSQENNSSQRPADIEASSGQTSKFDTISKVCGLTDTKYNVKPLVVGGEDIKRGSWPWLAAIFLNAPASLSYQCGGNLITNRLVLTSAHCFYTNYKKYSANDVIVFLGRHNIHSWDEKGWISSSVDGLYTHPDYKNDNLGFDADIALVLLKNEVTFNEYIRPVCLWPRASTTDEIEGETGVVVGWGRNEADQRITDTPKRIETTVVSDIQCLRSNEQFRLLTSNRTFCAGHRDGNGPCTGDSGGGFMLHRNKKWWIRGTVSASLLDSKRGSCNLNEYVIYVDISKFIDWIKSFMLL